MSNSNKINIKLEIFKDQNSGKMLITAHFSHNAPNIYRDGNGYIWMPTQEERDLINEAFELISPESVTSFPKTDSRKWEEDVSPVLNQEIKTGSEKPLDIPLEKHEPVVFEVTTDDTKTEKIERKEQPKSDEMEAEKKEEDDAFIVEADEEAINAALKKHAKRDEDGAFVEADEQTIIEKVLSQKKKGKWSKK